MDLTGHGIVTIGIGLTGHWIVAIWRDLPEQYIVTSPWTSLDAGLNHPDHVWDLLQHDSQLQLGFGA